MATNYAHASYTEVVDLQTINEKTTIIGLHTPTDVTPYLKLKGFFKQFRKYKYKGISKVLCVPAAVLPVDPLGISGIAGTTDTMDPRDNLNPIMFHGCHGESMDAALNMVFNKNFDLNAETGAKEYNNPALFGTPSINGVISDNSSMVAEYYKCLTDPTWKKFGAQQGVSLHHLRPLVHRVAMNHPINPMGVEFEGSLSSLNHNGLENGQLGQGQENISEDGFGNKMIPGGGISAFGFGSDYPTGKDTFQGALANPQMFTNGLTELGWMPTFSVNPNNATPKAEGESNLVVNMLPRCYMGILLMSPSYKCEQYYRMIIKHEFEFKDFTASLNLGTVKQDGIAETPYFDLIDHDTDVSLSNAVDAIGGNVRVISDGVN